MNHELQIDLEAPKFIHAEKGELSGELSLKAIDEVKLDKLIIGLDALFPYPEKEKFNQKRAIRIAEQEVATDLTIQPGALVNLAFDLSYQLVSAKKEDPMFQLAGKWSQNLSKINDYISYSSAKYQLVIRVRMADGTTFREYVQMRYA